MLTQKQRYDLVRDQEKLKELRKKLLEQAMSELEGAMDVAHPKAEETLVSKAFVSMQPVDEMNKRIKRIERMLAENRYIEEEREFPSFFLSSKEKKAFVPSTKEYAEKLKADEIKHIFQKIYMDFLHEDSSGSEEKKEAVRKKYELLGDEEKTGTREQIFDVDFINYVTDAEHNLERTLETEQELIDAGGSAVYKVWDTRRKRFVRKRLHLSDVKKEVKRDEKKLKKVRKELIAGWKKAEKAGMLDPFPFAKMQLNPPYHYTAFTISGVAAGTGKFFLEKVAQNAKIETPRIISYPAILVGSFFVSEWFKDQQREIIAGSIAGIVGEEIVKWYAGRTNRRLIE